MRTFAERQDALKRLGWEVSVKSEYRGHAPDREPHDLEIFSSVVLPLTGNDWVRLCAHAEREGYPSCLRTEEKNDDGQHLYERSEYLDWDEGPLEEAQRRVQIWLYRGGCIGVEELVEVGDALRERGDDQWGKGERNPFAERTPEALAEAVEFRLANPEAWFPAWTKIALLYHLVRDHYEPEIPNAQHERTDELEGAFRLVSRMAWVFGIGDLFSNRTLKTGTTEAANYLIQLYRFLPAFNVVYERARRLAPEPVEGWALVDLEAGEGEVAENRLGYCIYATRAEAERIVGLWRRSRAQREDECCTPVNLRKPVDEKIGIRAVRVSLDQGIEFLDEGAEPKPRVKWKARPHWYEEETEDVTMLFEQYAQTRSLFSRTHPVEKPVATHVAYEEALMAWQEAAKFFGGDDGDG